MKFKLPVHRTFILSGILFSACSFFSACTGGGTSGVIECGGGDDFRCPIGTFCEYVADCGGVDKKGTCQYQPTDCPAENEVVCGCDRKEYTNACLANAKGITVKNVGTCLRNVPKE